MKPPPAKSCASCGERYDSDVLFCPRDGTPLTNSRTPSVAGADRDAYLGVELAGQIRLKHLIGIGSMGRVYRAFQAGIDRDVAVKILHRELSGNTELVQRFHREAKVASRLVHPNVVQVLMTGAVPFCADPHIGGELYLVMEYLDGISLLSALAAATTADDGAALPLPRALHVALQICDAVGEAHKQGIVHRDLKPENVMLIRRGDDPDYVKVLDFGIARLQWGNGEMTTQAGLIFGTAKYISPEGAEGQAVGPAADVYAISTILYQCLAGRTPFEGDSPVALLVQHTHAPPPELRTIARASYVPPPLAAVVMQGLSKKPSDRFPNARVLGREIIAAARESGLDPEEIVSQSALLFQRGRAVKLASKERTKSLELSADLASKIGGIAAVPAASSGLAHTGRVTASREAPRASPSSPGSRTRRDAPRIVQQELTEDEAYAPEQMPKPSARLLARSARRLRQNSHATTDDDEPSSVGTPGPTRASRPQPPPVSSTSPRRSARPSSPEAVGGAQRSSPPGRGRASVPVAAAALPPPAPADLDFDDAEAPDASAPPREETMQGTETTLDADAGAPTSSQAPPRRARIVRMAAIAACALAAALVVVFGGRHFGGFGASASGDSIDAQLEVARECMRRHAWDAPARQNLKEITDQALARWPNDARVLDLRREAAERLVSDALGRKYAGDTAEAIRLTRLALEMNPGLTTAQHLVAELEGTHAPDVAPAASAGATDEHAGAKGPRKGPLPHGATSAAPGAPSGAATAGPVLPPTPPALPGDHAPPAPSSTGPWL